MERLGSPSDVDSLGYVSWEEVKSDKGRREIRYYLKKIDGGIDLAVIGKEKSLKHISYRYVVRNTSALFPLVPSLKPKSRREVIDWLNFIVSDSLPFQPSNLSYLLDNSDSSKLDIDKDIQLQELRHYTKEFLWLGCPWTCRKRRKHYQSFCRNGVKISLYDFVCVLAEEDERLVAYLEDMYEDSKGYKMVVVRWFHKIDEVGIALPHKFNDREIFFSLCLQDLNVECIDGRATVLSPQHFDKFLKEPRHAMFDPFVCYSQFQNEDVRPFDITRVKGYWKQEVLRYMHITSPDIGQENIHQFDDKLKFEADINDDSGIRPRKRHRPSQDIDVHIGIKESTSNMIVNVDNVHNSWINCRSGMENHSLKRGVLDALLSKTEAKQNPTEYLKVGSEVEVLSQDSGIRGCWFRALIIKRHKDMVKVRYQDVKDADNEANKLEEWMLATRVAVSDQLRIRISGRLMIRPPPKCNEGVACVIGVGTVVDVWWHDVWQEGIVVQKESEDSFRVYFSGEKQDSVFGRVELRRSQEWVGNGWIQIRERPDIVNFLSSVVDIKQEVKTVGNKSVQAALCGTRQMENNKDGSSDCPLDFGSERGKYLGVVCDLSKDDFLARLRWNSSKKRRRSSGSSSQRMHQKSDGSRCWKDVIGSSACKSFLLPLTLKVDHENCKYMGDSLFGSAVAQPLTSLVMSS